MVSDWDRINIYHVGDWAEKRVSFDTGQLIVNWLIELNIFQKKVFLLETRDTITRFENF